MSCRRVVVVVVVVVILLFIGAFISVIKPDAFEPQFRKVTSFTAPPYTDIYYNFMTQRPFEGGKAWLTLIDGTNRSTTFLFDLEQRKVVGQLLNAQPAYSCGDRSAVICVTRGPTHQSLAERCRAAASSVLIRFSIPLPKFLQLASSGEQFDTENYWVVDLNSNRATLLGQVSQHKGAGSSFYPSPDFRFGFNKPTATGSTNLIFLCDLEEKRIRNIQTDGWPAGWWSDHQIVMLTAVNDNNISPSATTIIPRVASRVMLPRFIWVWDPQAS